MRTEVTDIALRKFEVAMGRPNYLACKTDNWLQNIICLKVATFKTENAVLMHRWHCGNRGRSGDKYSSLWHSLG